MNEPDLVNIFQMIVDDLNWPVVISDDRGRYLFANRIYRDIRGLKPEDIEGRYWWDFVTKETGEVFERERLKQILKNRKFVSTVRYYSNISGHTTLKWDSELWDFGRDEKVWIVEKGKILDSESKRWVEPRSLAGDFEQGLTECFESILRSVTRYGGMLRDHLRSERLKEAIMGKLDELKGMANAKELVTGQGKSAERARMIDLVSILSDIEGFLVDQFPQVIKMNIQPELKNYRLFGHYVQIYEALMRLFIIACGRGSGFGRVDISAGVTGIGSDRRVEGVLVRQAEYGDIRIVSKGNRRLEKISDQVFEPFQGLSGSKPAHERIYGLILPLIYKVIKQHRGYIFIEDKKENGFRILFPLVTDTAEQAVIPAKRGEDVKGREERGGVLLVDPDPRQLDFMESLVREMGYSALTATDYQSAMGKYFQARVKPRLLIIDPLLPLTEGTLLIRKIKEFNRHMKVLVISDASSAEIQDQIQNLNR